MNTFNRVVLVVLCLLLMFAAGAAAALAWAVPTESIDGLRDAAAWLDERNTDGTKAIITGVAVAVGVLALAVLIIELYPRAGGQVKVTDLHIGDAVLSTAAVSQRVEEAVSQVPSVSDARASVRAKRSGVVVNLDLHVDPEANLATVIDEASEAARSILADKVHVALAEPPRTRIHYRELRLRSRPPRRTSAAGPEALPAEAVLPPESQPAPPPQREEETALKA